MITVVAQSILQTLEDYYHTQADNIDAYVRTQDDCVRETLWIQHDQEDDHIELALVFPSEFSTKIWADFTLDEQSQLIEGVSHFLVVCERSRAEKPTTQLELELQAEIDKWLIFSKQGQLAFYEDAQLRSQLYEQCSFIHAANSLEDQRYRYANQLAARFTHSLSWHYVRTQRRAEMREQLIRFFNMNQEEKLRRIRYN